MSRLLLACLVVLSVSLPHKARAEAGRELIMSSAYGVLAGTLVGAATLAFTERPGDNLKNIARGASLGLYAGILLGLYVVYIVPTDGESDQDYSPEGSLLQPVVYPLLTDNNALDGAAISMKVLSF